MPADQSIHYLKHTQIDKLLWDQCISEAANGLIYGYSSYLDHMADHWDGLVLNNYEAVMPLPWRKKFGVYYLYQPFVTAQLGLFGNGVNSHLLQQFLDKIPSKFKLWEFSLNSANLFHLPEYNLYKRRNYILNLNKSYEELYDHFRETIKRNIKRSFQYGCTSKDKVEIGEITSLLQQYHSVAKESLMNFSNLYAELKQKGQARTYGVASKQNELLASAVFFFSHYRAYYILVGNHPNGRTLGASHALINAFIKDHAGQNLWLDFEGSDIHNLAFFYSSFGAKEEAYAAIRMNKLPWYTKWLK